MKRDVTELHEELEDALSDVEIASDRVHLLKRLLRKEELRSDRPDPKPHNRNERKVTER
jgi:hypothetical protein